MIKYYGKSILLSLVKSVNNKVDSKFDDGVQMVIACKTNTHFLYCFNLNHCTFTLTVLECKCHKIVINLH